MLPPLMVDAQRLVRTAGTPARREASHRLLADVYHLGQLYLCYQDAPELLWVVVDRAMSAALASGDAATIGRAAVGSLVTPAGSIALSILVVIGIMALYWLQRLLESEEES